MNESALRVLRDQHGLITRDQALGAGLTERGVRYLVRSGRLVRVGPCLYGTPGHRESWVRELWAAWLHAGRGAWVSHHSAGRLHSFGECEAGRVQLIVTDRRRHPPEGTRWFRLDDLEPSDVTEKDGLPVTTPARTVVDLAGVVHVARLRLLVERGAVERQFTLEHVGATLARVRRKGKPGVRALSLVLDELGPGGDLPRSELERLVDHAIVLSGVPAPVHEHPLPGTGAVQGFVDRCWPDVRLIVEADGRRWHDRRQQMVRDNQRTLQAQAAGYEVSRFTWEQLRHDARGSAECIRAIYDRRLQLFA